MEQFQKGYSVLENIPEEKAGTEESLPKRGKHEVLWYWFLFSLIATIMFIWAIIMAHLQYTSQPTKGNNVSNVGNLAANTLSAFADYDSFDTAFETSFNPANVLGGLNESDPIRGEAWQAWSTVEDSAHQHICKIDNGVSDNGTDFVVKRFDIICTVSSSEELSSVSVFQSYNAPRGINITGLIAIDRRKGGSGDSCNLDGGSFAFLRIESNSPPVLRFTFLVIGRKVDEITAGQSNYQSFAKMIIKNDKNETIREVEKKEENSDEKFKDYVY